MLAVRLLRQIGFDFGNTTYRHEQLNQLIGSIKKQEKVIGKLNIHEKMKLLKREHAPQLMEIEKEDKNFDDNICMMCHMPLGD